MVAEPKETDHFLRDLLRGQPIDWFSSNAVRKEPTRDLTSDASQWHAPLREDAIINTEYSDHL